MSISKMISDITGSIDALRSNLGDLKGRIEALEAERRNVEMAPPHTDDIVALFERGIQSAASGFEVQFTAYLTSQCTGSDGAAAKAVGRGRADHILQIDARTPADRDAALARAMRGDAPALNAGAIAYFLREKIAEEIPSLVDRLCPSARKGLKSDDRQKALQSIDDELADLRIQRDELLNNLESARSAILR